MTGGEGPDAILLAGPTATTLEAYSATAPLTRTIRSQGFHDARFPRLEQYNFSILYNSNSNPGDLPFGQCPVYITVKAVFNKGRDGVFLCSSIPKKKPAA